MTGLHLCCKSGMGTYIIAQDSLILIKYFISVFLNMPKVNRSDSVPKSGHITLTANFMDS